MIRMFARHPVSDFTAWRQAYDDFDQERRGMGGIGDAVFPAAGDPNDVTIGHDFETMDAARTFADSDRLREVLSGAGVAGPPEIWFTTKA